jgi:uncharacterized membrane protein
VVTNSIKHLRLSSDSVLLTVSRLSNDSYSAVSGLSAKYATGSSGKQYRPNIMPTGGMAKPFIWTLVALGRIS